MGDVQELRLVLTVSDFEAPVALYRDALGLEELADWSSGDAKIVVLDGGRATLELINEEQAKAIDQVEVGSRVTTPWNDRNVRLRDPEGMQLTLFTPLG
jgi:hypothetical protein